MTTSVVLYYHIHNQLPQILWLKIAHTIIIPRFLGWESWHSVARSLLAVSQISVKILAGLSFTRHWPGKESAFTHPSY